MGKNRIHILQNDPQLASLQCPKYGSLQSAGGKYKSTLTKLPHFAKKIWSSPVMQVKSSIIRCEVLKLCILTLINGWPSISYILLSFQILNRFGLFFIIYCINFLSKSPRFNFFYYFEYLFNYLNIVLIECIKLKIKSH